MLDVRMVRLFTRDYYLKTFLFLSYVCMCVSMCGCAQQECGYSERPEVPCSLKADFKLSIGSFKVSNVVSAVLGFTV